MNRIQNASYKRESGAVWHCEAGVHPHGQGPKEGVAKSDRGRGGPTMPMRGKPKCGTSTGVRAGGVSERAEGRGHIGRPRVVRGSGGVHSDVRGSQM